MDIRTLTSPNLPFPHILTNFRLIIAPSVIEELKLTAELQNLPSQVGSVEGGYLAWNLNAVSRIDVFKRIKRFRNPNFSIRISFSFGAKTWVGSILQEISAEVYTQVKTALSMNPTLHPLVVKGEDGGAGFFKFIQQMFLVLYTIFFILGVGVIVSLSCRGIYHLIASGITFTSLAFTIRWNRKIWDRNWDVFVIFYLLFLLVLMAGVFSIFIC